MAGIGKIRREVFESSIAEFWKDCSNVCSVVGLKQCDIGLFKFVMCKSHALLKDLPSSMSALKLM